MARIDWVLASANPSEADKQQIAAAIEAADFPARDQNASWQAQRAWERYPEQVAQGLLRRLEAGRDLPYRASDMLTTVASVDDGPIAATATNLDAAATLRACRGQRHRAAHHGIVDRFAFGARGRNSGGGRTIRQAASDRSATLKGSNSRHATGLFRVGFAVARRDRSSAPDRTARRFAGRSSPSRPRWGRIAHRSACA